MFSDEPQNWLLEFAFQRRIYEPVFMITSVRVTSVGEVEIGRGSCVG